LNETGQPLPPPPLEEMVQPCSEACRHFAELATDPWGDYGVCRNPRTPVCGYPVKSDRDCRWYEPTTTRR
jgi:hypothetical protein